MIRTQIQLTDEQARRAIQRQVSLATVIGEGVDDRAISAAGQFRSGGDGAAQRDLHLPDTDRR